jgi:hypothetical protein
MSEERLLLTGFSTGLEIARAMLDEGATTSAIYSFLEQNGYCVEVQNYTSTEILMHVSDYALPPVGQEPPESTDDNYGCYIFDARAFPFLIIPLPPEYDADWLELASKRLKRHLERLAKFKGEFIWLVIENWDTPLLRFDMNPTCESHLILPWLSDRLQITLIGFDEEGGFNVGNYGVFWKEDKCLVAQSLDNITVNNSALSIEAYQLPEQASIFLSVSFVSRYIQ